MTGQSEPDVRLELPAQPASAGVARHVLGGLLPDDMPPGRREQLLVAVSEAVTNAVLHGHHDGIPGNLTLLGRRDGDLLEVRVIDPGRGMIPRLDGRGLGIGLSMVAAAADSLEVRGEELRITFALRS
jgi:anti-sigma regulatory factor (Ser/Thr protein kinase)